MSFIIEYPITVRTRMIIRYEKLQKSPSCPDGNRFAVMGFIDDREVIRIDNSPHKGEARPHIHIGERVVYKEISFKEARDFVEGYLHRIGGTHD